MQSFEFTEENVLNTAKKCYNGPICIDLINQAMQQQTFKQAVDLILMDCLYCDEHIPERGLNREVYSKLFGNNPFNLDKD